MPAFLPRPITAPAGAAVLLCGILLAAPLAAGAAVPDATTGHARPATHPVHRPAHVILHRPASHAGHIAAHHAVHPARPVHHAAPPAPVPAVPVAPVAPAPPPPPPKGSNTGLPLPRFASLRADAVNMRSGPGTRYPIQWVYKRRDLPVEIEREFDVWRLIEDSDGVKGWVHQATLVGTRSFVIPGAPAGASRTAGPSSADAADPSTGSRMLRAAPQPDAAVVAILKPGVIGRIRSCSAGSGWCRVSVRSYSGWLPRSAFWGLLPDETILPP